MAETEATESAGGLLTQDSKRRRTKGGVFFYLAKGQMDPQYLTEVFPNLVKHGDGNIMPPGIEWADRLQHMQALRDNPGQINNLTVKLTGSARCAAYRRQQRHDRDRATGCQSAPYPKGVPPFGSVDGRSTCYVFMGLRHWQKVEKALENEKDMLVIEGTVIYDPQLDGISILSTGGHYQDSRTAKATEAARREIRRSRSKSPRQGKTVEVATSDDSPPRPERLARRNGGKIRKLYDAADRLRLKLVAMQDKEQTSGVAMTPPPAGTNRKANHYAGKAIRSISKLTNTKSDPMPPSSFGRCCTPFARRDPVPLLACRETLPFFPPCRLQQ